MVTFEVMLKIAVRYIVTLPAFPAPLPMHAQDKRLRRRIRVLTEPRLTGRDMPTTRVLVFAHKHPGSDFEGVRHQPHITPASELTRIFTRLHQQHTIPQLPFIRKIMSS